MAVTFQTFIVIRYVNQKKEAMPVVVWRVISLQIENIVWQSMVSVYVAFYIISYGTVD